MSVEKVSLSLEEERRDLLAGLLTELEQEHGPIESQVMEEVRQAWPAPGEKPQYRSLKAIFGILLP
jgi:hypothetical protein